MLRDFDSVLVKLFAENSPSKLVSLLRTSSHIDASDVSDVLTSQQCHHALATLYYDSGRSEDALRIWKEISEEKLVDCTFPGFQHFVDVLSRLDLKFLIFFTS